MYDIPELREATDAWWSSLAGKLVEFGFAEVPMSLDREDDPLAVWRSADFLLGQCCGYDLRLGAEPEPTLVATPCYAFPGCEGPLYCSFLVVREEEATASLSGMRGKRAAVNLRGSHSGHNVLRALVAEEGGDRPYFSNVVESGGHRASLACVRHGEADVAAIDCVTFGLLGSVVPEELLGLKILAESPKAPGLPYITAPNASGDTLERLRAALKTAEAAPELAEVRAALGLLGFEFLPLEAYEPIVAMARRADSLHYPNLL